TFRVFLTVFAVIALVVAMFSIYNTYSVVGAQRARESALLGAAGATRAQLVMVALAEAVTLGLLCSAAGVAGGFALATLLKGLFAGFGFALPVSGLDITAKSVVLAVCVGTACCGLAALVPALRGSRVAAVAALRE